MDIDSDFASDSSEEEEEIPQPGPDGDGQPSDSAEPEQPLPTDPPGGDDPTDPAGDDDDDEAEHPPAPLAPGIPSGAATTEEPRRSERERRVTRLPYEEYEEAAGIRHNRYCPANVAQIVEPKTYESAISGEQGELWKIASDEEMASILENDTWEVVKKPPNANIIDVKWVYKVKRDADGQVTRFKARLVAKGYKQIEGIDYTDVFAPVSKYTTIRVLMGLVALHDLELELLDIKTAFLNGELEEEVYINHPPGYPQGPAGTVLRLKKTLYGLKQAPRAWYQRLDAELGKLNLKPSAVDPSLYIWQAKTTRRGHTSWCCTWWCMWTTC